MALALWQDLAANELAYMHGWAQSMNLWGKGYSCNTHNMIILCIQEDTHANRA